MGLELSVHTLKPQEVIVQESIDFDALTLSY